MDYAELSEGVKYFEKKWPANQGNLGHKYAGLRARGADYWLHLEAMNGEQLVLEIINGFLNTSVWNCVVLR